MLFLDIRTIMFTGALMFLVIGVFIFISSRKKSYKGIMLWNIGNVLITSGIILFILQGITEAYSSILVSNVLLLVGYSLLSAVLLLFLDINPSKMFYLSLNIIHCGLMACFIYITFNTNTRIIINSSSYMVVIAYTVTKIYGNVELRRNKTYLFVLMTYAIVFLNYLFKIVTAITSSSIHSVLDANIMMAIHFIILLVSYFVFTMNLYDILVKRFENEMIDKVHELEKKKDEISKLHKELEIKSTNLLAQQKELLEAVIGEMTDALVVYSKDKSVFLINDAAKKILYQPEDFKQLGDRLHLTKCLDMSGNEISAQDLPAFRSWRGEKVHNFPLVFQRPDKTLHARVSSSPVYGEENEIGHVVVCIHDITDLVEEQKKVKQQKYELEAILENISDAVFVFDVNNNHYRQNKAAKEYFPNVKLSRLGDSFTDTRYYDMDGKELTSDMITIAKVIQGQVVNNDRIKMVQGDTVRYLNVSGTPVYDETGSKILSIVYSRDITEDIHKQMLIEQQKEFLESIIDNMSECLYIYDKDGKCILKNSAADNYSRKVKKAADNYKPNTYFDIDGNEVPFALIPLKQVLNGKQVKNFILCIKESNETEYLDISGVPLFDENGDLKMGLVYMHDITDLVQKQNMINEQNEKLIRIKQEKNETLETAMKMKDEFLYLITHEFKTPINVISAALQMLALICKDETSPKARRFLDIISQNTKRQLRLVNNLLDITRINARHIKLNCSNYDIVYLTKAIVDSVQVYAQQKNINVRFSSTLSKKEIYIDDEKYERILLNLLSNALKFTLGGKSINVTLKAKKYQNKNMVSVSVQDEGIGIPKDKQDHIFEQFGQADTSLSRKAEGCGIGLYLVKLLVDAQDGIITLESEEGQGSNFTVLLPAAKAKSLDEIAAAREEYNSSTQFDNRLVQAVDIEFSDIYF